VKEKLMKAISETKSWFNFFRDEMKLDPVSFWLMSISFLSSLFCIVMIFLTVFRVVNQKFGEGSIVISICVLLACVGMIHIENQKYEKEGGIQ